MDQQPNSFNPPRLNDDPVPPASYMSMVLWKNILLVWTFPIFPSASILGRLISWVFHVRSLNRFILRRYNAFFIHFQVHERFIFMSSICARLRYSFSLCYNHSIRTFFLIFFPSPPLGCFSLARVSHSNLLPYIRPHVFLIHTSYWRNFGNPCVVGA